MTNHVLTLPFSPEEYSRRINLAHTALERAQVDTAVLTAPDTIAWLTGYRSRWYRHHTSTAFPPMHALILQRENPTPTLIEIGYHKELALEHSTITDFRAVPASALDEEPTLAEYTSFVRKTIASGGRAVGLERWSCVPSPAVSRVLEAELVDGGHTLSDVSLQMRGIRRIKSAPEIDAIRRAQKACDSGIETMVSKLHPAMSGLEAWGHYTLAMVQAGGEPAALHETVAGGSSVSAIHALSDSTPLGLGPVVYPDMAAAVHGYHARATRPVTFGPASDELRRLTAHAAGVKEVFASVALPGAEWAEVAAAVNEYSARTGIEIGVAGYELGLSVPPADWVCEFSWSNAVPPDGRIEAGLVTNIEMFNGANLVDTIVFGAEGPEWLSRLPLEVLEARKA